MKRQKRNFPGKNQQNDIRKPALTQLTVKDFFQPKSQNLPKSKTNQLSPPKTIKKRLELPFYDLSSPLKTNDFLKIIQNNQNNSNNNDLNKSSEENLAQKIDDFLNKKELNYEKIYHDEKNEKIDTPKIENLNIKEGKSTSNSRFADKLLSDYLKTQDDEKLKILSKFENPFQILQVFSYISMDDTIPYHIISKIYSNFKPPFTFLVLSHQLFCKNLDFYLLLSGKWQNLSLKITDSIEIFGSFDKELFLSITNETPQNYLIYEPNITLFPTLILDSHKCLRKGVLSLKYIGRDSDTNMALVIGCLAHKLFEYSFKGYNEGKLVNVGYLLELYEDIKNEFIEDLFIMEKSEKQLKDEFITFIDYIADWFKCYIYQKKEFYNEKTGDKIKILRVIDTESMIVWNDMGLKGQLDAILYCEITDKSNKTERFFIPFELKSGKEYFLHFYQGYLYSLLLSHKYEQKLQLTGIFYYLQQNKVVIKTGNNNDIVDLVIKRNALAYSIKQYEGKLDIDDLYLPEMLEKNLFECKKCNFKEVCCSVDIAYKGKDIDIEEENNKDFDVYQSLKDDLGFEEKEYLKKWMNLLKMEENFEEGKAHSLKNSTKTSKFSQISDIPSNSDELMFELENVEKLIDLMNSINCKRKVLDEKIIFSFIKSSKNQESLLNIYEKLSLIDNANLRQLETKLSIRVFLEYKKIYQRNNEYFLKFETRVHLQEIIANIDKLNNFIDLLYINPKFLIEKLDKRYYPNLRSRIFDLVLSPSHQNIKEMLVLNKPNSFNNSDIFRYCSFENILNDYKKFDLNSDQIETIRKSLLADHFNLILGMPGTGKTHTLAILIKILWDLGFRVLISSYTHSALDNLLDKVLNLFPETKNSIMRFGKSNEKYEEVVYERKKFGDCKAIEKFLEGKKLCFVTTLSSGQRILSKSLIYYI